MWNALTGDTLAHPGWPVDAGPLRVRAGLVTLRPVRRRDGRDWSALRLHERDYLEPWEPTVDGNWHENNSPRAWPGLYSQLRRYARAGATIPAAIELDGRFCGQLTVGGIVRGALHSGWIGYWVGRPFVGGGVATAALALGVDHDSGRARCTGSRPPSAPRTRRAGWCWGAAVSGRRGCFGVTSTSTVRGATTCWWRAPGRSTAGGRWPRWWMPVSRSASEDVLSIVTCGAPSQSGAGAPLRL